MSALFGKGRAGLRIPLMIAAMVLLSVHFIRVREASGQTRTAALSIEAPATFQVESQTETPLVIRVAPEAAVPRQALILIRGLPPTVTLSEGRLFQSGIWAVRISDLQGLKIKAPATPGATSQLSISLVALDGSLLAEATSTFMVTAPDKAPIKAPEKTAKAEPVTNAITQPADTSAVALEPQTQPAARPAARRLTPDEMRNVDLFMSKGEDSMKAGQINVARLFFKRAAQMGWAPAAMALGATYDAAELERMGAVGGIQADVKVAKQWYEMARELGDPDAQQRITRLGSR